MFERFRQWLRNWLFPEYDVWVREVEILSGRVSRLATRMNRRGAK
jgi:hypothetical protein